MKFKTELIMMAEAEETFFDKYINSLLAGDIKNLTIKEEWIMLEELKNQREEYVAEVERLKNVNLDDIVNARFELIKETIAGEVKAEFDEKLAAAELNVKHYDFVIANMEEKVFEIKEVDIVSDIEEVNEVPAGSEVYDCVNMEV